MSVCLKLLKILEAKIEDILDIKADKVYKQDLKDNSIGHQEIQNMCIKTTKKYMKNLLSSKDEQIALLKSLLDKK